MSSSKARYFRTPVELRRWFQRHHASAVELIVGYYKKDAVRRGKMSITWPESVAEALCFGWIDGIRRTVDEDRYTIRFTPRRPGSNWSAINVRMMAQLEAAGKMTEAGRTVFAARPAHARKGYTTGPKRAALDAKLRRLFMRSKKAWAFFQEQPPGYRRQMAFWIMQPKREETRLRRLQMLVDASAKGERLR